MKIYKIFAQDVVQGFLKVKNIVETVDNSEISKFIMKNNYKNFINNEYTFNLNVFMKLK